MASNVLGVTELIAKATAPLTKADALKEVRDLARRHTVAAIARLVELMHSRNEAVAVRAAEAILNRGWGQPTATLEASGPGGSALAIQLVSAVPRPERG